MEKKIPMICTKQVCPNCQKADSERDEMEEVGDGDIYFPSTCNNCGAKFNEVFRFLQTEIV